MCGNTTEAFNMCAVVIGSGFNQKLVVTVYRAPWVMVGDTNEMCSTLDDLITNTKCK